MHARVTLAVLALASGLSISACASRQKAPPAADLAQTTPPPAEGPASLDPGRSTAGVRPGSQQDLAATAGERVFFALDSHELSAEARATLDRQAAWLARYPGPITIEGNADERGTREYNLALGARRADSVRQYLIQRGVASSRLRTISYGKERPIDPRSNEEGWAINRNARTVVDGGAS